jgi:NADH-quinone oxidoreductase subunit N
LQRQIQILILQDQIANATKLETIVSGLSNFTTQYLLVAGILTLVMVSILFKNIPKYLSTFLFLAFIAVAFVFQTKVPFSFPLMKATGSSNFFQSLALVSGMLTSFIVENSRRATSDKKLELYVLLLFTILGMSFLAISENLLMVFLGLECISIPSYCLAAFGFYPKSIESAVKYVLYGSGTTGILLFGVSLIYGLTGTLDLARIFLALPSLATSHLFILGVSFMLVGIFFKISAFPFHSWAPDVYEGTPTPIVAFFSIAPKALAFSVLIKLIPIFEIEILKQILVAVSIMSMTAGNLLALSQTNAKRLLAYSSVSHAGFLLMGIVAGGALGEINIIYYLTVYVLMNFSAFHLLKIVARWKDDETLEGFSGLGKTNPYLATSLLITMISLTGLPPAAGFSAKLFMFAGVYESYKSTGDTSMFIMLLAALLNTVLSLFYYLKMPFYAFFRDNGENKELSTSISEKAFILTLNALLLVFFFKPDWVFAIIKLTKLEG